MVFKYSLRTTPKNCHLHSTEVELGGYKDMNFGTQILLPQVRLQLAHQPKWAQALMAVTSHLLRNTQIVSLLPDV